MGGRTSEGRGGPADGASAGSPAGHQWSGRSRQSESMAEAGSGIELGPAAGGVAGAEEAGPLPEEGSPGAPARGAEAEGGGGAGAPGLGVVAPRSLKGHWRMPSRLPLGRACDSEGP